MKDDNYTSSDQHCALLRFANRRGEHYVFPYASLVFAKMVTTKKDEDILELVFASHEVTIRGYRLLEVLEAIRKCRCALIQEVHNPKAPFGGEKDPPAILSVEVGDAWEKGKE
jgi:hypothetical protein